MPLECAFCGEPQTPTRPVSVTFVGMAAKEPLCDPCRRAMLGGAHRQMARIVRRLELHMPAPKATWRQLYEVIRQMLSASVPKI